MKTGRFISRCLHLIAVFLLTVLIAGCGGTDSDQTAPALIFTGTDPNTTSRTRELAGTVEAGAVVEVTVDTAAVVNNLVVADGNWSCTIDSLVPGNNLVTILATDATGNQAVLSLSLVYDAVSIERWVSPIRDINLVIGGLVDPAANNIDVTVNTTAIVSGLLIDGDQWRVDLSSLEDGDNVVTVKVNHPDPDVALVERTQTITRNAAVPVVTIDPVSSPTVPDSQLVQGTFEGISALAIIAPSASPGSVLLNTDSAVWSAPLNQLQQGKNPFTVSATANGVTTTVHDLIRRDATPPSIVRTVPSDAAVDVSPTSLVQAFFNETMQAATLGNDTFAVNCQGIPVDGTVTYDAATRSGVFTPTAPLPSGACTGNLVDTIADPAGNALSGFSWSFTVN